MSGLARSGKDTMADILVDEYGFRKAYFAFELKRIAHDYLGWNGKLDTKGNWEGGKDDKGRTLLQRLGTEVGRSYHEGLWTFKFLSIYKLPNEAVPPPGHSLSPRDRDRLASGALRFFGTGDHDLNSAKASSYLAEAVALIGFGWDGVYDDKGVALLNGILREAESYDGKEGLIKSWKKTIMDLAEWVETGDVSRGIETKSNRVVVTDTRFPNELKLMKSLNFMTVKVVRPGLVAMAHGSETSLNDAVFDEEIQNDSDLDSYLAKVRSIAKLFVTTNF
jgi:hypothetical protein